MKKFTKENIQEKIREVLDSREEIRFAYLFGSRVEEVSRPESDLDLAIYLDKERIQKLDPLFETRLALEIEKAIDETFEVDILVLNRAPLTLKYQATDKGELIYYRDEAEARDYEALIRKKYFDFSPCGKNITTNGQKDMVFRDETGSGSPAGEDRPNREAPRSPGRAVEAGL